MQTRQSKRKRQDDEMVSQKRQKLMNIVHALPQDLQLDFYQAIKTGEYNDMLKHVENEFIEQRIQSYVVQGLESTVNDICAVNLKCVDKGLSRYLANWLVEYNNNLLVVGDIIWPDQLSEYLTHLKEGIDNSEKSLEYIQSFCSDHVGEEGRGDCFNSEMVIQQIQVFCPMFIVFRGVIARNYLIFGGNTDYSTKTNKLLQDKRVMADITLAFNSEKFKQKELVGDTAYLLTGKVQRAYLNTDETVVDHKDFNKLVFMARQNLKFLIKTVGNAELSKIQTYGILAAPNACYFLLFTAKTTALKEDKDDRTNVRTYVMQVSKRYDLSNLEDLKEVVKQLTVIGISAEQTMSAIHTLTTDEKEHIMPSVYARKTSTSIVQYFAELIRPFEFFRIFHDQTVHIQVESSEDLEKIMAKILTDKPDKTILANPFDFDPSGIVLYWNGVKLRPLLDTRNHSEHDTVHIVFPSSKEDQKIWNIYTGILKPTAQAIVINLFRGINIVEVTRESFAILKRNDDGDDAERDSEGDEEYNPDNKPKSTKRGSKNRDNKKSKPDNQKQYESPDGTEPEPEYPEYTVQELLPEFITSNIVCKKPYVAIGVMNNEQVCVKIGYEPRNYGEIMQKVSSVQSPYIFRVISYERLKKMRVHDIPAIDYHGTSRVLLWKTVSEPLLDLEQLKHAFGTNNTVHRKLEILTLLMKQMLEGLSHIHSQGVLHLDISCGNIMLRKSNDSYTPVYIDFGCSKLYSPKTKQRILLTDETTYPYHDDIYGQKLHPSIDIFSLGVLFAEMYKLVITSSFQYDKMIGTSAKNYWDCIRVFVDQHHAEIPATFCDKMSILIRGMIASEPTDRHSLEHCVSSINELAECLIELGAKNNKIVAHWPKDEERCHHDQVK